MPKHTRNTDNSGIPFYKQGFTINNTARKLQKCWTQKIAFKNNIKIAKATKIFLYGQPSELPKETLAKFNFSTTFGLSFMISSVDPTGSSTFYANLITKIGNRYFNPV